MRIYKGYLAEVKSGLSGSCYLSMHVGIGESESRRVHHLGASLTPGDEVSIRVLADDDIRGVGYAPEACSFCGNQAPQVNSLVGGARFAILRATARHSALNAFTHAWTLPTMPSYRFKTSPRVARSVIARRRSRIVTFVESLPEAAATVCGDQHQHLSLEVRGKRFGYYLDDHHGDRRVAINCKVEPGANQALTDFAPDRFHIPAYLGARGWVGLWIDLPSIEWDEVESILVDAYRLIAPKRLVAQIERPK